jgi:sec-independent protein translocase protein TatC
MLTGNGQIEALLTLTDYLSFVMIYLAGSALIFQLPVVLFFINNIKALKLRGLMRAQRWIILGSFIAAAVITPTPDLTNMLIVALPIILIYQLSIVFIWLYNRYSRIRHIEQLAARDAEERARREQIQPVNLNFAEPLRSGTTMDLKPSKNPTSGTKPKA